MVKQGFGIDLVSIRCAIFPTPEQDPDPFVRQSPNGTLMTFTALNLQLIIRFGPTAPSARMVCKFLKGLPDKFRTGQSPVDPAFCATLFRHGCDARELLYFCGGRKTIPIRAKCRR